MTTTENWTENYGAADELGSQSAAPRRRRAARQTTAWAELLENRHLRRQVAGQLGIRVEQLRMIGDPQSAEREANDATAELLDDLIDALRAV